MPLKKPATWGSVIVVAIAAAAATLLVTAAFASDRTSARHHGARVSDFSVIRRGRGRARATTADAEAPSGAILADVTPSGTSVYASSRGGEAEVCLLAFRKSGSGGGACGPTAEVEENGVDLVSLPADGSSLTVTLLVPDGVQEVSTIDGDGTKQAVAVKDNVAVIEDPQLAKVDYALPSGAAHSIDVGAMLKRESAAVAANG